MTPETCVQLHQLRHAVLGARDRGRVVIEFTDGPGSDFDANAARLLVDAMLALVNLPPLGPHWRKTTEARAREIMAAVLHEDLESMRTRVPAKVAVTLANRVLSQFTSDAVYLTNVKVDADLTASPHKWASGRVDRELDAGVVVVCADLIGLLWVEDRP